MPKLVAPAVVTELPRDRWGRPLISPPDGSNPVAYTRATTFAKTLDDTFHLDRWQQRMVVLGLSKRRDLQLAAAAVTDPDDYLQKKLLQDVADRAKEHAGPSAAAVGTALHTFTEHHDKGFSLADLPDEYVDDIEAYSSAISNFEVLLCETFVVNDEYRVGGTFDRLVRLRHDMRLPDALVNANAGNPILPAGTTIILDNKTGKSVDLGAGSFALQLGMYANSLIYNHETGSRSPLPGPLCRDIGIILHLPAGKGRADLHWLDLRSGWEAAPLCAAVRAYRSRKDLIDRFETYTVSPRPTPVSSIAEAITTAPSLAALTAVYKANKALWTPGLNNMAKARKEALEVQARKEALAAVTAS